MRTKRGARLAISALAGTAGLLAILDLQLLQGDIDISPLAPSRGRYELEPLHAPTPVTALDKKSVEQLAETVGRPLFHPSRRPVQRTEAAASSERTAEPPSKLRLIGIVRIAHQPPRALIRFAGEPMGKWLAEGAEHKGWRLSKVNARSVMVQSGQRAHELTLPALHSAPAAPVAGAAPQAGEAKRK
ncbi:MAG TPA: hypothetical protein VFZ16_02485 [Hyphomicrobiaceae bacterium]|nr:hypothetical protein [Hyphomicrobiaceae bacterium]